MFGTDKKSGHVKNLGAMLVLAALYFAGAKLGLTMAFAAEQVTVVWPPTGIALAALLLLGTNVWPGILLGAFLANITAHEPMATACGIAIGNTLEALVATILLKRFARFDNAMVRLRDVLGLLAFSAIAGTMLSATIGVLSLCFGGVQPWSAYRPLWLLWWLGDTTGALIFAPVFLAWGSRSYFFTKPNSVTEILALIVALTLACVAIFTKSPVAGISGYVFVYLIFPFVIWASLRFGQRGTALVTLISSSAAIWSTVHGIGPFTAVSVDEGLTLLQLFTIVIAVTGLLLAAAITERKRAEEEKSFLASIVASSEDAIIGKNLHNIINFWNAGAERLFGYSSAEVIGQPITLIIPPDRQEEETHIMHRLQHGEHMEHYETVRVAKNGRKINISVTISPILDNEGRLIGASKLARDITERKKAEEALKEADRHKDEFLATLAHELRNPLAPLSNALYVLEMAGDDPEQCTKARSIMQRQVQQMTRLVDDLLDASRISHGKIELRKEPVLLADAVNNAIETVKPLIAASKHSLSVHLPQTPCWLDADPMRLSQVFANLLNNAAKYTHPGGHIVLEVTTQDGTVTMKIRDSGIGISPVMMTKIFDLFTQADNTIERAQGGLGIGLTLVKKLVEMHGGKVEVASEGLRKGSEFTVQLPLIPPPPPKERPLPEKKSETSSRRLRVLVVDDNKTLAETLGWMVELLEHDVKLAHDGEGALAAAQSFLPDVILLDIGLSGMSGYEVCQKIRAQEALRDCVIIAQTGWGQEEHRQRSKAAGFDHHLVKPVKLDTLEQLLASLSHSTP